MSQLSANTCNIVTIFPLGVICNPTDAFKPNTPNGSIQLNISGGTPPYTTSWSNGQQGNVGFVNYYMSNCDYQNDFVNGNPTGCLVYINDGVTLVGNGPCVGFFDKNSIQYRM